MKSMQDIMAFGWQSRCHWLRMVSTHISWKFGIGFFRSFLLQCSNCLVIKCSLCLRQKWLWMTSRQHPKLLPIRGNGLSQMSMFRWCSFLNFSYTPSGNYCLLKNSSSLRLVAPERQWLHLRGGWVCLTLTNLMNEELTNLKPGRFYCTPT